MNDLWNEGTIKRFIADMSSLFHLVVIEHGNHSDLPKREFFKNFFGKRGVLMEGKRERDDMGSTEKSERSD